jgi:O-antigen ligase/tetratricopeptide (TPR) repeat protein
MIITSLLVFSIGWLVTSSVYNERLNNYNVARHIGLAAIISVPLLAIIFVPSFLYPYIVGKAFVFRFLAIISLCSTFYLYFTDERYHPRLSPFLVGYAAFAFVMLLATVFSMDPGRSFWSNYERMEGYINLISLFVLALSAISLKIEELEWRKLFVVHIVVSSVVSFVGVLQYVIGILHMNVGGLPILNLCLSSGAACRIDSTLGNSIYLGIYAALTFWLIIFAIFGKKIRGNLLPFLAVINLFAVYFSGTRGVWLGMFLGLIVLVVSKYWFDGNRKAVAGTILSGLAVIVLFGGFIFYAKQNNIMQDVTIVQRFSSVNTLFARWNIWKTAIISWEQKPILGWGQENFIHAFNLYYNPAMYGQETYFDHPHNTYLGWLVFGGILGFLAFLFMLGSSVYGIIKSNLKQEEENDLIIPILLALITTYVVHIFFVFDNLTSSLLFVLMSVYFGTSIANKEFKFPVFSLHHKKTIGTVMTVVAFVLIFTAVYKPSYANMTTIKAMTFQQTSGLTNPVQILDGTREIYDKALAMETFGNYEIREFYLQKSLEYINLLPQVTDDTVKVAINNIRDDALNNFLIQIEKNPFDHRARFMLGLYYLNTHDYDKAVETLEKAVELAPNKQIALIYLAKAYIFKGDLNNAAKYYQHAIEVTPSNIAGYNQIRTEYISVLLLASQDQAAISVIKDLLPPTNRDDFTQLAQQMSQVYSQRKDLKNLIKFLSDASNQDLNNQNYVLWLAQAYVSGGDYNNATMTINRLSSARPDLVAQFNQELQNYINQQKQNATPTEVKK